MTDREESTTEGSKEETRGVPGGDHHEHHEHHEQQQDTALLPEATGSTVQDIVQRQYAVRARAFQLAIKEFVVGWHETRRGG